MRRPIVAANWKMHNTRAAAGELARRVVRRLDGLAGAEVVLCPPFTALEAVAEALSGAPVRLGAQNVHWEGEGAFTGEVSAAMLRDVGCEWVIVGHSERRSGFGESDGMVRRKTEAVLRAGMRAIVCVGETLDQREAGHTETVLRAQIDGGLRGLGDALRDVVVAYEPVWAIGTGKTASAAQAQQAHAFIRGLVGAMAGDAVARELRIQYGGSVKPANAAELFALPDVDGGLIGGASLDAASFAEIVRAALD